MRKARQELKIWVGVAVVLASALVMPLALSTRGAWAEETCVKTAILTSEGKTEEFCDDGTNDGGVVKLLQTIADIMTAGIGVLGVIGITWAGIQYLTAGGSEEKTRVAKRRIYEIVIGLIAYILIYVILRWLLPGFGGP